MTIRYPFKATSSGIQEMSAAECAYIRYRIRNKYANDTDAIGWLAINDNISWSSIGVYGDTFRSAGRVISTATYNTSGTLTSGSIDPVDPTTSTTNYTFYQNKNFSSSVPSTAIKDAGTLATHNGYNDLSPLGTVALQDVYDTIIDPTIQDIEGGGNGRFYIGTATPAGYTNTGDIALDTRVTIGSTAGASTVNTYRLSIRTGETAPSVVRPVKYSANGMQEMTDAEIDNFFYPYFLNRIGEGNRLVYTLSGSTTGIDVGSISNTIYSGIGVATAVLTTDRPAGRVYTYTQDVTSLTTNTLYLRLTNT